MKMLRLIITFLILAPLGAFAQTTPSQYNAAVNSVPWSNGMNLVPGAAVQHLFNETTNTFFPLIGGTALGPISAPGIAISFLSYGAKCDGSANDSAAFATMLSSVGATVAPVTVTFPATCLVDFAPYTISGNLSFQGLNGGGIRFSTSGQTLTDKFLYWTGGSYSPHISNLTIDINNAVPQTGIQPAVVQFAIGSSPVVTRSSFVNAGVVPGGTSGLFMIAGYGLTNCEFSYNYFSGSASPSIHQLQSLNFGTNSYPLSHCKIDHNISANMGVYVRSANDLQVTNNEVYGWGYGAGITLGSWDTNFHNVLVANNDLHDSQAVADDNSTLLEGIEGWIYDTHYIGNTIRNTCGNGIYLGGNGTAIGNNISNVGTCNHSDYSNSGILATSNGTEIGSNSTIIGNKVWDDGTGNTAYGYSEISSITGVVLTGNDFQGSKGAYNIQGGAAFGDAQIDNRVVNPCMYWDQFNAGAAIATGKSADQWVVVASHGYGTITSQLSAMGQCNAGLQFQNSAQVTPAATDTYAITQSIGRADLTDLAYAQASAKPMVFAFCAKTTLSPPNTFSAAITNLNVNWSVVYNYTITMPVSTPQCFSFRILGDTAHALTATYTAAALKIRFDLGSGSNFLCAPTNVWAAGNCYGSTTATAFVSNPVGSKLTISNVRLLPASNDLGWQLRTPAAELANVQRFAWTTFAQGTAPVAGTGVNTGEIQFPASIAATGVNILHIPHPVSMFLPTQSVTAYNPVTGSASTCRDETGSNDGGAATASNQSTSGLTLSCAGNAGTTVGNKMGLHIYVYGGI